MGIFTTPSLGDSISVALRKLLQGGRRGNQAICKFATKGAGSLNSKDQISSQGIEHSMYGKTQISRLTALFLSYTLQLSGANPVSSFTLLLSLPAPQESPCGVAASTGSQIWEPFFFNLFFN